jgi:hypothetical protein
MVVSWMYAMKTAGMLFLAAKALMLSREFFVSAFRVRIYTIVQYKEALPKVY